MANYVKFKQGLKKDFNTTNQPLTNGMIYFVIDENNHGSIYYDTIVDGKKATKNGTVHRVKFSGLPIKITGSVIGTGVISQDGETIEINTSTNHSHGLAHQDFTVTLSNDDTNLKWTRLGNQNGGGFWLKSIRGQSKAPAWFLPDFSAGIAFGGADTKGIISVRYSQPGVRFAGGNGDAPVWYFTITGANDKTYDLSKIGGHSSDSAKLDHNVTFKIASTADATKGGSGTATNLSGSAVDLYLPTKISGFDLLQATRFQGNADTSTVAAKLGRGGNTSLPMTFNWSGQDGQPTWLWGGENGTDMYVYNPSNFRVAHSINTAGLDHDVTFKISKVANATTGETGVVTKLTGALLELILPASISGFNLIQSTRFQGNADSATVASRANSLFLNPSNRQENINYQINSDQYQSRVTYSLASSITKTGKPPVGDSHVLTFGWDGSGWGAQLAITADAKPHIAIRGAKAGEKGVSIWDETWSTVLDSSNYTSYINNYYWADVKVSTTANAKTNPNFFNVTSSGWFFSNAPSTGWQNSAHGGGIYMKDSSYVRIYGGKKFAVENTDSDSINTTGGVKASGGFTSDAGTMKIYAEFNNEINFGGTNPSNRIYFGYRKKDSKEIPSIFVFGSDTGTANIQANAGWFGQKYLSGDNWIGWYAAKGDTSSKRYGYIQTDISDNGNMRFVKEGGGYFTFNSHVNPNQTNAYDLGTQALAWRTLYVNNLNLYGQTANRLVWTNGANAIQASHHYASSTQVSIGDTSPVGSYTFYVKGDSLFQGNIRVANDIYMAGAGTSIYWDSDTYRQRLLTTDDSTANTPVFTFQQSEDAASSWKNLLIIRDNGVIEPLANSGGIYKNFTANNQNPVIWMNGNDTDNWLWQISSGTSTKQYFGYGLKYIGTGSGIGNLLRLYADNQGNADVVAIGINQNGQVGIGTDANVNHRLMVSGTGYFSDTLYATHIGILNTASNTGKGISLYGGGYGGTGSLPTYGIAFAGVGTFDSHGAVCNDWATYFTMDSTSNRGWIFRTGNTNVASINNKGYAAFSAVGKSTFIAFPDGGSYVTTADVKTGYLKITLPQRRSNTMLSFKVSIYNYSSNTSCEYTIKGYNYYDGVWHQCTAYSIGYNGDLSKSNLPVYYGETASNSVIYIGDVATSWSYPQIQIHDVAVGFQNYEYKQWCCNWNIDFVTTLENVTASIDKPNSSYAATKLLNTRNIWGQPFNGTADVAGQLSGATRIMNRSTQPLYLGNADNSNWVFTQDICSHSGTSKWAINTSGYSWFQYTNIGYAYDSNDSAYRLRVNGASYIDGSLTIPNKSCFYGILGSNSSTNSGDVGGLTWFNISGTAGAAADTNDTPSSAWWYILRNRHTNQSNNYYTDVAIPFNDNSIYYKIVRDGNVVNSKWVQVLDVDNYTYTLDGRYVLKTGDTMTGNLRIKANDTSERFVDVYNSTGHIYLDATNGRMGIWTNIGGVSTWLISTTKSNAEIPRLLQISSNGNTITIGSQNSDWCHLYNSANIPFIFNKTVASTDGNLGTTGYPWHEVYANGWFRSIGTGGWYSETYGGGWHMTDSTYIRNYGSKTVRLDNLCLGADNNNYRLYVNETSLHTNTINIDPNTVAIDFRYNDDRLHSTISYQTSGNEALVFANKYAYASFLFITNEDSVTNHGSDRWKSLTSAGLQIKENCVQIGGLWGNDVHPDYKLKVNGTSYFTDFIRIPNSKSLIQDQASTSNYTCIIEWRKGGGAGQSGFTYNPHIGQHNTGGADGSGSVCVLPYATSTEPWGGSVGLFITKNRLMLDNCRVPTTGNTTGTIGSATVPVYSDNGVLKTITSYSGNAASATYTTQLLGVQNNGSNTPYSAVEGNLIRAVWNIKGDSRWYLKAGTYNCRVNYADNAGNADTTDGVHLEWADSQAASATDWIAGWSADGKKIKAVKRSDLETKNADTVDGYHADDFVKKAGDTMTGPLYTSFKSSVAIGSYEAVATTVQDLVNNVRYSSGCMGSVSLTTNYSATGGTILAGWYNFIYSPHRSGGRNGTAVGDNCNYGTLLLTGMTVGSAHWRIRVTNGSIAEVRRIWNAGDSVTGAVWNDYAECRQSDCSEPGRVVFEKGDDTLTKTEKRLQHFAGVISDTWGFSQGETDKAKTNIAVAGRVLVYTYQDRNNYKPGDCVCAAPNGTIDIMTREEIIKFPDRIVGTVSYVPDYEEWGGGKNADRDPVKVNGRIWIKVK